MIKILDIASTDIGAYRLLRTRVKAINTLTNFTNIIVCPKGVWADKLKSENIPIIEYELHRNLKLIYLFKEINLLYRIIKYEKPNIIHSHNSKSGALARIVALIYNLFNYKNKIKVIHQVHGYHFTYFKSIKKYIYIYIEWILSLFTDVLLFQNKYEYNISIKYLMNIKAKLIYIGNGIDLKLSKKFFSKIDEKKNILSCVARIEPVKNHIMILKAINYLINEKNFKDIKVFFIGEGNSDLLNNFIANNNLSNNIIFLGEKPHDKVLKLINESKILLLTSIKEGKPRCIMEAMALGIPCIATNVIGTNETIINNKTGFLVELDDYKELAEKITLLLENKTLYDKFSSESILYAKLNYDENTIINELIDIYKKLI